MATRQKHIFTRNKPLIDIYSCRDHEGKELAKYIGTVDQRGKDTLPVELKDEQSTYFDFRQHLWVEVREDAEQQVKYHEIVEALAAAGYHRAHMHALSAFDKIVGGMTWCIEICDIDVDVNLLFEENLTIGKKIALTEKIVAVLPSMRCPYTIEPHQIQGLDFINIHPLIVWLIKHSDEFREAKEDELRRFAVSQYDKNSIFECDRARFTQQRQMLKNLAAVQNLYKPCRVRKRKGPLPKSELEQVNSVLSEYDQRALLQPSGSDDSTNNDEGLDFLHDIEKSLADPSKNTILADRFDKEQATGDVSERKLHYDILKSELSGEVSQVLVEREKANYLEEITKMKEQLETMEREVHLLKDSHERNLNEGKASLLAKKTTLHKLKGIILGSQNGVPSNKDVKELESVLTDMINERGQLQRIIEHKTDECNQLEQILRDAGEGGREVEAPLTAEEARQLEERERRMRGALRDMRLEVARVSREALALAAALDDRPAQAELLQYERRFVELLNQVAAKHKETKQFFTFYNTLYEVKLYISKELSLLNSILENYEEAMSSTKKREQFMSQLESIVEWVKTAVKKVEQKYTEEREKKARLGGEYTQLLEVERQYAATLKKLAEERRKLRHLVSKQ